MSMQAYFVFSNLTCLIGTTSLDPKSNGKVSAVGFTYIFITNTIGALIGLAGGLIAQPGNKRSIGKWQKPMSSNIYVCN